MQFGSTTNNRWHFLSQRLLRQLRFPSFTRGVTEALLFALVFLAAGHVSLGYGVAEMLEPMVPVVLLMMICICLLYTSPSPRDRQKSRMPSSA